MKHFMKFERYLPFLVLLFSIYMREVAADPINCATQSYLPYQECIALEDIYISTNGSAWDHSEGWMTDSDPCTSWYGVDCEVLEYCPPSDPPPICFDTDRVTTLDLRENHLNGVIPSSISKLSVLKRLFFQVNNLYGSIPTEIGSLVYLETLFLQNNLLSGSIPTSICNLHELSGLYLGDNSLSNSIPANIGNLAKLTNLWLHDNQLSGLLPTSLGNLTELTSLYLQYNQLSGSIPLEIGNLKKLNFLYLDNNHLSGSIPYEIGTLTSLVYFFLNDNQLCGEIPVSFLNLVNLFNGSGIDISNNYLRTDDAALDAFLMLKGGDWESSQGARCPADSEKTLLYQIFMGASQE